MLSSNVSRRDMATQMSPKRSSHSSLQEWSSLSPFPSSLLPIVEPHSDHSAKLEVRDVQVDKWASVIRWSKRYGARKKDSLDAEDLYKSAMEGQGTSWDFAGAANKYVLFAPFCLYTSPACFHNCLVGPMYESKLFCPRRKLVGEHVSLISLIP